MQQEIHTREAINTSTELKQLVKVDEVQDALRQLTENFQKKLMDKDKMQLEFTSGFNKKMQAVHDSVLSAETRQAE